MYGREGNRLPIKIQLQRSENPSDTIWQFRLAATLGQLGRDPPLIANLE
jgi:hypothetical protein